MKQSRKYLAAAATLAGLALFPAAPSQARIVCKDGFQKVAGNMIATPYCQDELLAKVAREYGMKASAARIKSREVSLDPKYAAAASKGPTSS